MNKRSDLFFDIGNHVFLIALFIILAYPLIFVLSASFSSPFAVTSGRVWLWPVDFSLEGYVAVFRNEMIVTGYANSFYYVAAGTSINVVLTLLIAYPLSRGDLRGRRIINLILVFPMLFQGGIIPTYLIVKGLGLLNSRWALILPNAVIIWYVFITRTYLETSIPGELLESAKLDGCSDFRFFLVIVVPLAKAVIAVITLFYAVFHWNQYFNALIYLKDQSKFPIQIVLRDILILNTIGGGMTSDMEEVARREAMRTLLKYSLIVVATLPLVLLYPFIQRYFVKGIMIGALKG